MAAEKEQCGGDVDGGYCAAKKEKFFGGRFHLICTPARIPVSFDVLPTGEQDLTPIHELTVSLPEGATIVADKGYVSGPSPQYVPLTRGPVSSTCAAIASVLKLSILNWRQWAFNGFMLAPITAFT